MKLCCSRAKTVNENLKMSAALLSRFDLVFILLDRPDELLDKRVSDHIMAVSTMFFVLVYGCVHAKLCMKCIFLKATMDIAVVNY